MSGNKGGNASNSASSSGNKGGFGGHGGFGGVGGHGGSLANVNFTFSTDNTTVQTMTVGDSTRLRTVDLTGDTFKTTVGTNDLGVKAVLSVERTQTETGKSEVTIYTDTDGNAKYSEVFDIDVITVQPTTSTLIETHAYTYAADGSIATDVETFTGPRGTHTHTYTDTATDNVIYQIVKLEGDTFVVRTVTLTNKDVRFEITRDDNGDGKWTTIAHGDLDASVAATYVDSTTGGLKLAGIIDYLDPAEAIIG